MNKIQQSKIFEVYETEERKKKVLFTINLTPGKKVYRFQITIKNKVFYYFSSSFG